MTAPELLAALKLTNNGYLFAPTGAELACAREHPELFDVRPPVYNGCPAVFPKKLS